VLKKERKIKMNNRNFKVMFILSALLLIFPCFFATPGKTAEVVHLSTSDLKGWKLRGPRFMSRWVIGHVKIDPEDKEKMSILPSGKDAPAFINKRKGVDIFTKQGFGDCILELEVMVPENSNSGIYLMGQYEIQIKDSHGKGQQLEEDGMGGIIGTSKPLLNAAYKAGKWQKIVIEFKAPRFKNGKRIAPAEFIQVILNGQVVQKNVKMKNGPTSGALQKGEFAKGPLMLQGGMGAVAFRNIKITLFY
jgi:hypothetical protein